MSITIEVTAKCESMTHKGTKCTKDATVYEPGLRTDTAPVVANGPIRLDGNRLYDPDYNAIPTGFRCNTHARYGAIMRAKGSVAYDQLYADLFAQQQRGAK